MIRVPPAGRSGQLARILEALAWLRSQESMRLEEMLLREQAGLPAGSSVAVITAAPGDRLPAALHKLKQSGYTVAFILVGDADCAALPGGVNLFRVPAGLPWQDDGARMVLQR